MSHSSLLVLPHCFFVQLNHHGTTHHITEHSLLVALVSVLCCANIQAPGKFSLCGLISSGLAVEKTNIRCLDKFAYGYFAIITINVIELQSNKLDHCQGLDVIAYDQV